LLVVAGSSHNTFAGDPGRVALSVAAIGGQAHVQRKLLASWLCWPASCMLHSITRILASLLPAPCCLLLAFRGSHPLEKGEQLLLRSSCCLDLLIVIRISALPLLSPCPPPDPSCRCRRPSGAVQREAGLGCQEAGALCTARPGAGDPPDHHSGAQLPFHPPAAVSRAARDAGGCVRIVL
jgi:hypothetical protein